MRAHLSVLLLALGASAGLPAVAPAQGAASNATLLSRWDKPDHNYTDVWGYVSPSGKEYALLGTEVGTVILDCSDPTNPVERATFSGPNSGWRDIRTYRHYAYVVTEGGGGAQIFDLQDPDNPVFVRTWGRSAFSNAHNVAIDTGAGTLWACGTNNGVVIADLTQNPERPTQIGNYTTAYVHDLHVQNGLAHLAEISNSRYRILDVGSLPTTTSLGVLGVGSCHNAWPSRDGQIAVATSETFGGALTVVDISNPRLPRALATYRTGSSGTSVHNAYLRDRVSHMAYYSEGYRAVDLSDPTHPVEVAYYDTSQFGNGYNGAWGCYPFQPSGVIYISDRDLGLHVIDSKASSRIYGQGTTGAGGAMPSIHTVGAAYQGNTKFALQVEGAAPNASVTLLLGAAEGNVAALGVTLLVDLAQPVLAVTATSDATGSATIPLRIPSNAPPVALFAQFLVVDPAGPAGLSASRGLEFDVIAPS